MQVVVIEFQRFEAQSLESFLVHRLQIRPRDLDVPDVGLRKVCKGDKRGKKSKSSLQSIDLSFINCKEGGGQSNRPNS